MVTELHAVCYGNGGRSPAIEIIGNELVKVEGLEGRLIFSSSGAGKHPVNEPTGKNYVNAQIKCISQGLDNDIYLGRLKDLALSVKEKGLEADPQEVDECFNYLMDVEVAFRNAALAQTGILPEHHKEYHQPLDPTKRFDLVLPVTDSTAELTRNIYTKTGEPTPEIIPIAEYAQVEEGVPNPFCNHFEKYQEAINYMKETLVPKVIERTKGEFNL